MSWNNIIPAWALYPVILKYNNQRKGFNTKAEADRFIINNNLTDYEIHYNN